jgi:hypothetical protein
MASGGKNHDGVYAIDELDLTPPLHPNCTCELRPILLSDEELEKRFEALLAPAPNFDEVRFTDAERTSGEYIDVLLQRTNMDKTEYNNIIGDVEGKGTKIQDLIAEQKDWKNKITERQFDGVQAYTGNDFSDMNGALLGTKQPSNEIRGFVNDATKGLSKASTGEAMTVFSGWEGKFYQDPKHFKIGGKFTENKFVSTSPVYDSAWEKSMFVQIELPKGANAVYVDNFSEFEGEFETLIQQSSEFEILERGKVIFKKEEREFLHIRWLGANPREI